MAEHYEAIKGRKQKTLLISSNLNVVHISDIVISQDCRVRSVLGGKKIEDP